MTTHLSVLAYDYKSVKDNVVRNVNNVITWFESKNLGSFKIGKHDIVPHNDVKILVLNLDKELKFDTYMSKLCQKAGNQINVLARLCNVLDEPSKFLLYNSFIECYFNYCSVVWYFSRILL